MDSGTGTKSSQSHARDIVRTVRLRRKSPRSATCRGARETEPPTLRSSRSRPEWRLHGAGICRRSIRLTAYVAQATGLESVPNAASAVVRAGDHSPQRRPALERTPASGSRASAPRCASGPAGRTPSMAASYAVTLCGRCPTPGSMRFAVTILRSRGLNGPLRPTGFMAKTRAWTVTDAWPIDFACGIMSHTTQTMCIEDGSGWSGAA